MTGFSSIVSTWPETENKAKNMVTVNISDTKPFEYNNNFRCEIAISDVYLFTIIGVESFLLIFSLSFSIGICCKKCNKQQTTSFDPPLPCRMSQYSSSDTLPRLVVYECLGDRDHHVEQDNQYETFNCDSQPVYANDNRFRKNMVFSIYANQITLSDTSHGDEDA